MLTKEQIESLAHYLRVHEGDLIGVDDYERGYFYWGKLAPYIADWVEENKEPKFTEGERE